MSHFQDRVTDNLEDEVMVKVKKWQSDVASKMNLDANDFERRVSAQNMAPFKNI